MICNFYLSVASRTIARAAPPLRDTDMLCCWDVKQTNKLEHHSTAGLDPIARTLDVALRGWASPLTAYRPVGQVVKASDPKAEGP